MADEENKMEAQQQSAADGASEKGFGERVRKRVKVKLGRGDRKSSGSGRSSRGKKSKGSSGITYSIAQGLTDLRRVQALADGFSDRDRRAGDGLPGFEPVGWAATFAQRLKPRFFAVFCSK